MGDHELHTYSPKDIGMVQSVGRCARCYKHAVNPRTSDKHQSAVSYSNPRYGVKTYCGQKCWQADWRGRV